MVLARKALPPEKTAATLISVAATKGDHDNSACKHGVHRELSRRNSQNIRQDGNNRVSSIIETTFRHSASACHVHHQRSPRRNPPRQENSLAEAAVDARSAACRTHIVDRSLRLVVAAEGHGGRLVGGWNIDRSR